MKRLKLPGAMELMLFAAMAVLCAGIVKTSEARDLALSLMSIPIFITAAMMGLHRSGRLASPR